MKFSEELHLRGRTLVDSEARPVECSSVHCCNAASEFDVRVLRPFLTS